MHYVAAVVSFAFAAIWPVSIRASDGPKATSEKEIPVFPYFEVDTQPALPAPRQNQGGLTYPNIYAYYPNPVVAVLEVRVSADGTITEATLVEANEPEFGRAAANRVKRWRVIPAKKDGVDVACRTVLILRATREDGAAAVRFNRSAFFAQKKTELPSAKDSRASDNPDSE